ncbi:GreA/GreB family elongation factor [Rubrivivax gelatinosus]|uniref:Regulator of nucleoside diphosphate kinase n=1 Tax=Rubrivivax gelatinosus TaxID=28068 RepID=A0A4R2M9T4_RUBGE|nr:GreA/GreB family elongation factor [Rubrivivax gelatinosus]MBK1687954.1 nucleoside-diphosphate kinase [Rubrivivax gelatinosus]TCO99235.1 regulator of nucleoside diphosphate kinase [Rubrivivax gelatinosus]
MNTPAPERQLGWLDHVRLFNLLNVPRAGQQLPEALAEQARDLLDLAEVVDPQTIPADLVTMRSRVRLERGGGQQELTLAYPADEPDATERISVFSPLGMALLGARVGEQIAWRGPVGKQYSARVAGLVYQPEAAGDFSR